MEKVVAAAVYHGVIWSLPKPARHHTIVHTMAKLEEGMAMRAHPDNQGFVTNTGRFVNRQEAYGIAYKAGQVRDTDTPGELYSEDLW